MTKNAWIPDEISQDRPNPARIYDYLLGGYHNFEADRELANQIIEVFPDVRANSVSHRAFLRRAVNFFDAQGVDQFLDIGSGIPTVGNVHQVAQTANPAARVVYVDVDPVVIAHSALMLKDNHNVIIVQGDLRRPEEILNHTAVRSLLDFVRPLAICITAVLHYLMDDEEAYNAVRSLREAVVPGSYIAISHVSYEGAARETVEQAVRLYQPAADIRVRSRQGIEQFFDGFRFLEPGLVRAPSWRPEGSDGVFFGHPDRYLAFVGVGRKP